MERRTNAQMVAEVRSALDVSATPYFSTVQVCEALTKAYADWVTEVAPDAESDERIRRELAGLIIENSATLTNGKVDLNGLNPRPYRLLAVIPVYANCRGKRAATPLSYDAWKTAEVDPWHSPDDMNPAYLDGGNFLQLLPTPASVDLVYIKRPKPILATEPEGKTEIEYEVQTRIIERAAAKLAIPQDNAGAYQVLTAEYTRNEQNT